MDYMVKNSQLTWKLAWILRIYRTYNSMVGFSKYEFYNKLLCGVILLRVIPGVTWIQPLLLLLLLLLVRLRYSTYVLFFKFVF